jgi:anti-anti-sigma regulatory factor
MKPPSVKPNGGFDIIEMHLEDRTVVFLQGELGDATARELRRRLLGLLSLPVENVTVDMAEVTAIDRSALDVLALVRRFAAEHSIGLALEHVPLDVCDTPDVLTT